MFAVTSFASMYCIIVRNFFDVSIKLTHENIKIQAYTHGAQISFGCNKIILNHTAYYLNIFSRKVPY